MADTSKPRNVKGLTPVGTAVYPWLNTPDTKFKEEGEYRLKFRIAKEDAAEMLAKLEPLHKAAVKAAKEAFAKNPKNKGKKFPSTTDLYTTVFDDEGNETGEIEFAFKRTASGVSKKNGKAWSIQPDLFTKTGKAWNRDVAIYGGSKVRVAYEVIPYDTPQANGIKLGLNAVQVIELVSSSRNADSYGFGNEGGEEDDDGTFAGADAGEEGAAAGEEGAEDGSADF